MKVDGKFITIKNKVDEKIIDVSIALEKGTLRIEDNSFLDKVNEYIESIKEPEPQEETIVPAIYTPIVQTGTRGNITKDKKLVQNKFYGTAAKNIYLECCDIFGFDKNMAYKFGRQQWLFAANVTPEGYDVWFLAHSNITATKGGSWVNEIRSDLELITENHDDYNKFVNSCRIYTKNRVVFAKMGNNGYKFLGVYSCEEPDRINQKRSYKLVSKEYYSHIII